MKDFILLTVVPSLAAAVIRILGRLRPPVHVGDRPIQEARARGENAILAFWHGQLLMMPHMCLGRPLDVMISRHQDGEMIARTMVHFGFGAVRGSSTRGGAVALKGAIGSIRAGRDVVVTPDGPKGPARIVQSGVIELARATGAPIFPVAYGVRKKKAFRRGTGSSFPAPSPRVVSSGERRSAFPAKPTLPAASAFGGSWKTS
ncbi:MAG: DUF374 domain-containing protein [Nitrospirae bacterium]|nr:DUF374 domain-containing protein [Nitrospirota bacterium]